MNKEVLLIAAALAVVAVNIGAFRYLGIFGLFVTAGSWSVTVRLLDILEKAK